MFQLLPPPLQKSSKTISDSLYRLPRPSKIELKPKSPNSFSQTAAPFQIWDPPIPPIAPDAYRTPHPVGRCQAAQAARAQLPPRVCAGDQGTLPLEEAVRTDGLTWGGEAEGEEKVRR